MKLHKGDNVLVSKGKDQGKSGKVIRIFPKENKVLIEGINLKKKRIRPRRAGQKGQVVSMPSALAASNVMLICPNCNKKTRIGFSFGEIQDLKKSRTKTRICKKCQKPI